MTFSLVGGRVSEELENLSQSVAFVSSKHLLNSTSFISRHKRRHPFELNLSRIFFTIPSGLGDSSRRRLRWSTLPPR